MKHLKHLLAALVFVSLIIFSNCGGGGSGGNDPDPTDVQGDKLAQSWTLVANGALVGNPGETQDEWNGFTLDITYESDNKGGNYSTSNSVSSDVWPSSGTWEFDGNDIGMVLRSDGVEINVFSLNSTATSLTLKFNISTGSRTGRISSVEGDWTFNFEN